MEQPAPAPTSSEPAASLSAPAPAISPVSAPQPASNLAPTPPADPTQPKKSSPWPWIIGGCLSIVVIIIIAVFVVLWWGARELKNEVNSKMDKINPALENMKKESQEWQKKSEEYRNNVPNPEDLSKQWEENMPGGNNSPSKQK